MGEDGRISLVGNFVLILHCDFFASFAHNCLLSFFYFPYFTFYHICHCTAIFYIVCVDNVPHFFSFFCCVLVGCLVSYCAYFLSLVFSLYYNFLVGRISLVGNFALILRHNFTVFHKMSSNDMNRNI